MLAALAFAPHQDASAQSYQYELMPDGTYRRVTSGPTVVPLPGSENDPALGPALTMRFGYVKTGDAALDERTRAGLFGLSQVLIQRTSVEPAAPDGLDLLTSPLELYPLIYFSVPENAAPLPEHAVARLNAYLRSGGALIIDTRDGGDAGVDFRISRLEGLLEGLDAPPLQPVPENHVLTRSFYLLTDFPGRYAGRRLWIEKAGTASEPRGDGVSGLFIGDADWISAWAVDQNGRDLYSVDGGPNQREMARRFGVNLVMYILTGSYKDDQVHLPALLERLNDRDDGDKPIRLPNNIPDGGPQ